MARSYRYLHYDVFTDRLFGGNQLAVVLDARGLSAVEMQAIAKEMNFSETTFVLPAARTDAPEIDVRFRIFTPGEELPIAGHPTIGTTFALARAGILEPGRASALYGLGAGPTPVTLTWNGDALAFVWMTQRPPVFGDPIADPARAATALSLPPSALADTPPQVISCGVPFLLVRLASRETVDRASADRGPLQALLRDTGSGAHGVFLFSTDAASDGATVYSRMFAPELGVAEDPATGIASGPVGCYLVRHKIVPTEKAGAMLSLQGVRMGRPSHVHIAVDGEPDAITTVRVGGQAVLAGEGLLYV